MTKLLKTANLYLVSLMLGIASSAMAAPSTTQTTAPSAPMASNELSQYTQVAHFRGHRMVRHHHHRMYMHMGGYGGYYHPRWRYHRYYGHHGLWPFVGIHHYGYHGHPFHYHHRNWYWVDHGAIPVKAVKIRPAGKVTYYDCLARYRSGWYHGKALSGGPCMITYRGRTVAASNFMIRTK